MIHKKRHPEWLLKEIIPFYPAWIDRNIKTTPYHLNGYSCGCSPLNWTGGPYRGWRELRGDERLLLDDQMMSGDAVGVWHPAWRLWEVPLKPGWTREAEAEFDLWKGTGRVATPQELGVPSNLWDICELEAAEAKSKMIGRSAA